MLRDDHAEVGFLRLPVQADGLAVRPIVEARTVCVMQHDHPLARKDRIAIADLKTEPLILLGHQRPPRGDLDRAFEDAGIRPNIRIEAHSVSVACGMVAAGISVTLVNELMAADFVNMGLSLRPLAIALPHRFGFATAADLPVTEMGDSFIKAATAYFQKRSCVED